MVTGNFRLQGVTEIGSTITEYYLSTSSIEPIGGGWSVDRPTVTRGFYLFMRTVTTLTDGSNFTSAPVCISGEAGSQGAKQRVTLWQENTEYLQGSDGEDWYDIVWYKDHRYLCLISHTSTSKTPQESVADKEGFWVLETRMEFVATRLLLSERIKADQIDVDDVRAEMIESKKIQADEIDVESLSVKKLDGAVGTFKELQCLDYSGDIAGSLKFGENSLRFDGNFSVGGDTLLNNVNTPCLGFSGTPTIVVYGTTARYYTYGLGREYTTVTMSQLGTVFRLYLTDGGTRSYNTVIFTSTAIGNFQFETPYLASTRYGFKVNVLYMNDYAEDGTVNVYTNGKKRVIRGGGAYTFMNVPPSLMNPQPSTDVYGLGWMCVSEIDNDWR